jgi:hypothetical protein
VVDIPPGATHSIENVGIILMGFGGAMMFRALGHDNLAGIALIAGLYHTLNHATFKGLLFLGAGSVLHATHTSNMEEMGGLIRRMPVTALSFLVGAVAISGLPPLNGFVSEWLTYQALLAGFGTTQSLTRVMFPIAGSLLALTAALAAACFVKAFGIPFLALPRSEPAANAREVAPAMRIAMVSLALLCGPGPGRDCCYRCSTPLRNRPLVYAFLRRSLPQTVCLSARPPGGMYRPLAWRWYLPRSALSDTFWFLWGRRHRTTGRPDCGLRTYRRQRIHRYRVLEAAANDLLGIVSAAAGNPRGIRRVALLPEGNPLRK